MKIKGAIFDMDGTLVDSLTFWSSYWKRFGKRFFGIHDFVPDEKVDCAVRTMIFKKAQLHIKEFYGLDVSDEEFADFSEGGVMDFYRTEATVKDGVFELLEHLKKEGIKLCVASATEKYLVTFALNHLGLAPYFETVLSCADIGKSKDVPDIYLLARDILDAKENELCVFEDSFVAIETAKKAGFLTVGIYDEHNFDQKRLAASSDFYIGKDHSMAELIDRIQSV